MKLKFGDFIIIGCVVLLAAGSLLLGMGSRLAGADTVAEVWQGGNLVRVIRINELTSPVEFQLDGQIHNTIAAERGRICFREADCPDKVCVHTGWISMSGQTAACVPNRALIKIVGASSDEDVVIR